MKDFQLQFLEDQGEDLRKVGIAENPGWPDQFGEYLSRWSQPHSGVQIPTLSLFSGAGGLDIGFRQAGFDVKMAIEIEQIFAATLTSNAGPTGILGNTMVRACDIREFEPACGDRFDFIIGGPPCQTFSAAGRRAGGILGTNDERGNLFAEYVRLLLCLKPRGFLFENVYGITGAENGAAWKEIQKAFSGAGYRVSCRILDAADYGVPQHRERLLIVGVQEGMFEFPRPTHGPDSPGGRPYFTAKDAIEGLPPPGPEDPTSVGGRYGHLLRDIPPGLNYSFYTEKLGHPMPLFAWRSKFSDFLYKADPDVTVRTIKAQGGLYTGPFHWDSRPFTIAELKRLQTFPDDYNISGGRQAVIQQIGNSVPPQLARILALSILEQVFGINTPIHLPRLSANAELGFRKRKRERTAEYAAKARSAVNKIGRDSGNSGALLGRRSYHAEIDSEFGYRISESEDLPILVNVDCRGQRWLISASLPNENGSKFEINVSSSSSANWGIPVDEVVLKGVPLNRDVFVAVWKAFETELIYRKLKADLIQLSGYYQYQPAMLAKMISTGHLDNSRYWKLVQQIIEGIGVRQQLPASHMAYLWKIEPQSVLEVMDFMRKLGYEVRNHCTNPQIAEGEYLIPYVFPTLNPMSVQLRKVLHHAGGATSAD